MQPLRSISQIDSTRHKIICPIQPHQTSRGQHQNRNLIIDFHPSPNWIPLSRAFKCHCRSSGVDVPPCCLRDRLTLARIIRAMSINRKSVAAKVLEHAHEVGTISCTNRLISAIQSLLLVARKKEIGGKGEKYLSQYELVIYKTKAQKV